LAKGTPGFSSLLFSFDVTGNDSASTTTSISAAATSSSKPITTKRDAIDLSTPDDKSSSPGVYDAELAKAIEASKDTRNDYDPEIEQAIQESLREEEDRKARYEIQLNAKNRALFSI